MQIKFYLLAFLTFLFFKIHAQELFPKKELYHVWVLASEDLDKGKFEDALKLYNSHPENPSFAMKSRQIIRLKTLSADAEKMRRKGDFAKAIDKYKEYRKLTDIGIIGIFEKRIEECLVQINKVQLTELTVQQRIITGFEWAHRGRQKISQLDTIGAMRDFRNARVLGGSHSTILKEQYVEGIRIVEALTKWGQEKVEIENKDLSKPEYMVFLESYRNIRNLDIPSVELTIKELKAELKGYNSLTKVAELCDTDLLIRYVQNNKDKLTNFPSLGMRLNEYKSVQNKINQLKQNTNNAATVESAYASLLVWIEDFPVEIRSDLTNCVKNEKFLTFENYSKIAKTNADEKEAARFSKISKSVYTVPIIDEEVKEVQKANSCDELDDFNRGIILIRRELSYCNPKRAKKLWEENVVNLKGCTDAEVILKEKKSLKDYIFIQIKNDSLLTIFRSQILQFKERGECIKIEKYYQQMSTLRTCNQDILDDEIEAGIAEIKNCKKNIWWRPELIGSFASAIPIYTVGGAKRKMENGYNISSGFQISFIDHKNPVDLTIGFEYFNTNYFSVGTMGSLLEDFNLGGINGLVAIKFHLPNTNPNRIRPYIKIGAEILVPMTYKYESFSNFSKVSGTEQLQKNIMSGTGAIGLEIQKQHFGVFVEGFGNYALVNSIYNSKLSHIITTTYETVESKVIKIGLRVGLRLW